MIFGFGARGATLTVWKNRFAVIDAGKQSAGPSGWCFRPFWLAICIATGGAVQAALVKDGVLEGTGGERRVAVAASTRRRWAARLRSGARVLLQVLVGIGAPLASVLKRLSGECSRLELVEALSRQGLLQAKHKLAELAAWIHRAVMGVRLM